MSKLEKRHILNQDQEMQVVADLIFQSDRSISIVAAANLDRLLYFLWLESFAENRRRKIAKEVFNLSNGALHSLDSKINLLYGLGGIGEHEFHDLHLIRKIRNDFAHYLDICDFNSPRISDQCQRLHLKFGEHDKAIASLISEVKEGPKRCFLESVLKLTLSIIARTRGIMLQKPSGQSRRPRIR
jgi:hypothetical protein